MKPINKQLTEIQKLHLETAKDIYCTVLGNLSDAHFTKEYGDMLMLGAIERAAEMIGLIESYGEKK